MRKPTDGAEGNGAAIGGKTTVINKEEIRKHLEIISAHATRLAEPFIAKGLSPGRLQLVFIYPVGETVQHMQYDLGNIEGMLKDAITYAEMGWNVYVEGRTVRSDARVGRGKEQHGFRLGLVYR